LNSPIEDYGDYLNYTCNKNIKFTPDIFDNDFLMYFKTFNKNPFIEDDYNAYVEYTNYLFLSDSVESC